MIHFVTIDTNMLNYYHNYGSNDGSTTNLWHVSIHDCIVNYGTINTDVYAPHLMDVKCDHLCILHCSN